MPSTVNRRCVVYICYCTILYNILYFSETCALSDRFIKFLWILLNKGYNMLNNTKKKLRWYRNLWSLFMSMTSLTVCRCPGFCSCISLKEISSKSKIWYPLKLFDIWIPQTVTCLTLEQTYCDTLLRNMKSHIEREMKEIWLRPMTKTPIQTENSKTNRQHKNATKKFDYPTFADRLRTASWSNNSHPTGVVKPVNGHPTFPLTAKADPFYRKLLL